MKPWLWLPPKWSHDLAPMVLPIVSSIGAVGPKEWKPLQWGGHHFPNPLGIAGGVDKVGNQLIPWQKLGAGFLEVGTVTPRAQGPNSGRIMDRDSKTQSIWNKMGFPNPGAETVKNNLLAIKDQLRIPLFINIGKNRTTENSEAIKDYTEAFQILKNCSETFVINISSPNTKGLRDLQGQQYLKDFLSELRQVASDKKLLVKLSPDLGVDPLKESLDLCLSEKMDGIILTNTTLQRANNLPYPAHEGGVSGEPLKELSRRRLIETMEHLGRDRKKLLVISVGGVLDSDEIQWRLDKGADLVQVYAALIYHGPCFFRKVAGHQWH